MEQGTLLNSDESNFSDDVESISSSSDTSEDMDSDDDYKAGNTRKQTNATKRITRSFGIQKNPSENIPNKHNIVSAISKSHKRVKTQHRTANVAKHPPLRHTAVTCYPVQKLPSLCEKVLNSLSEQERNLIDIYELQNLAIELILDADRFGKKTNSRELVDAMLERVMNDRKEITEPNKSFIRQASHMTFWHDQKHIASVIERYKEQMSSEEMENKRSYLNHKFAWTKEDIEKFKEAYQLFGNGPNANKLIAAHVGNGVHPNHVAHFKKKWKKKQKQQSHLEV